MDTSRAAVLIEHPPFSHLAFRRHGCSAWWKTFLLIVLVGLCARPGAAQAQAATLRGFVTDASNGQSVELANVVVESLSDGTTEGTVTNDEGVYVFPSIDAGRYALRASFIGFSTYRDTLTLAAGEVRILNIRLGTDAATLGEVVVQDERQPSAARVTAGQQTIRPAELRTVPTPDLSADLASYLTALPATVTTGDRGGQFYIRGGEPSQNRVLLDGMPVYQPFHMLGFYSAFPADVLRAADFHAGGFGARYGGRLSSVLDVRTRNGNTRSFEGAATLSPFVSGIQLEGPIWPGRASMLIAGRRSFLEEAAEPLTGTSMPFEFGDLIGKLYVEPSGATRLSFTALETYDRGTIVEEAAGLGAEELRWRNQAFGARFVMLPRVAPFMGEVQASYSRLQTEQGVPAGTDQGVSGTAQRTSTVREIKLSAIGTFFAGKYVDTELGVIINAFRLENDLRGLYQNTFFNDARFRNVSFFVEPDITPLPGLSIRPGVRLQVYRLDFLPHVEPRLRIVWEHGRHQLSAAAGLYYQELVGISDRRDATNLFTAWTYIPGVGAREDDILAGQLGRAVHGLLGYRISPTPWLDVSIEGFVKKVDNLFVAEWTASPRLTTRLQPAKGRTYGFDTRVAFRTTATHGSVSYGYSNTLYEAERERYELWFGQPSLTFRPPHDRRHQVNALLGATLSNFDLSVRWQLGSGLPFSRVLGFGGFILMDGPEVDVGEPGTRRVIYERPYNAELPSFHRLDLSVERTFSFDLLAVTLQASAINVYDRRNILYLDVFTLRRSDQLPFVPSVGVKVHFQ